MHTHLRYFKLLNFYSNKRSPQCHITKKLYHSFRKLIPNIIVQKPNELNPISYAAIHSWNLYQKTLLSTNKRNLTQSAIYTYLRQSHASNTITVCPTHLNPQDIDSTKQPNKYINNKKINGKFKDENFYHCMRQRTFATRHSHEQSCNCGACSVLSDKEHIALSWIAFVQPSSSSTLNQTPKNKKGGNNNVGQRFDEKNQCQPSIPARTRNPNF